jgi:hypothetical protein
MKWYEKTNRLLQTSYEKINEEGKRFETLQLRSNFSIIAGFSSIRSKAAIAAAAR